MLDNSSQTDQNRWPPEKDYSGFILLGIGGVGLAVLGLAVILCFKIAGGPFEYGTIAILILVGIAAFLLLMNLLSFSAGQLGILTHGQAFGLPDGSVRAILTMAFIVLVGVIASYLITRPDSAPYSKEYISLASCVPADQANEVKRQVTSSDVLVAVTPCDRAAGASSSAAPGAAAGATSSAAPGAAAGATSYDVRLYPRIDHRLSEDIAKQILTMLSTILTAMIGFYFGAKQGSTEDDRIGGKPRDARSGAPEPGLSAAEREAAAKSIDEQLANAPDTDDLQTRATQLAGRENLPETARNEAKGFQDELPDLKKAIDTARATRTADATTAAQMQNAAASAKTAVERLQSIAQRIVALEQTAS